MRPTQDRLSLSLHTRFLQLGREFQWYKVDILGLSPEWVMGLYRVLLSLLLMAMCFCTLESQVVLEGNTILAAGAIIVRGLWNSVAFTASSLVMHCLNTELAIRSGNVNWPTPYEQSRWPLCYYQKITFRMCETAMTLASQKDHHLMVACFYLRVVFASSLRVRELRSNNYNIDQ